MKRLTGIVLCAGLVFAACATGTESKKAEEMLPSETPAALRVAGPDAISGINWYLAQIRKDGAITDIDRSKMKADNMADWFRIRFEGDRVVGIAAPNNYNGPCKWGSDSTLGFGLLVSTKMMAFMEPGALNENQYFRYLEKVKRWALTAEDRLELYTVDENGAETALVFGKDL